MRGRILISALLVLALLPVYSFAAICGLNCCATLVSKPMAMSSMEGAAAHHVSLIDHRQHHSKVDQSTLSQNAVIATGTPEQTVAARVCCSGNQTASSASCGARNTNALQEPVTAPKFDSNPAVLPASASIHTRAVQDSNRVDTPRAPVRDQAPSLLTLRI